MSRASLADHRRSIRDSLRRLCVIAPDADALIDAYHALASGPLDSSATREAMHAPRRMLGFVGIARETGAIAVRRGVRMVRERPCQDYTYNGSHVFVAPIAWQRAPSRLHAASVLADLLDQAAASGPLGERPVVRGGPVPWGARGDLECPPRERVANAALPAR